MQQNNSEEKTFPACVILGDGEIVAVLIGLNEDDLEEKMEAHALQWCKDNDLLDGVGEPVDDDDDDEPLTAFERYEMNTDETMHDIEIAIPYSVALKIMINSYRAPKVNILYEKHKPKREAPTVSSSLLKEMLDLKAKGGSILSEIQERPERLPQKPISKFIPGNFENAIEGDIFPGYYNPTQEWNGSEVPLFERHIVDLIAEQNEDHYRFEWKGDTLLIHDLSGEDPDEPYIHEPVRHPEKDILLWQVGGYWWTWNLWHSYMESDDDD